MSCPSCHGDDQGVSDDRRGEVVRRCRTCGLVEEAGPAEIAAWVEMFESPSVGLAAPQPSPLRAVTEKTSGPSAPVDLASMILRPQRVWSGGDVAARPWPIPAKPGVYGCWFDVAPPLVDASGCETRDGRYLLYVGTSGNLARRMGNHFVGTAEGSTLRKSLGCLLADELGIRLWRQGRSLTFADGEAVLSDWMRRHVSIAWVSIDNRFALETDLIGTADLPLNLEGNETHPFYPILRAIRLEASRRAGTSAA